MKTDLPEQWQFARDKQIKYEEDVMEECMSTEMGKCRIFGRVRVEGSENFIGNADIRLFRQEDSASKRGREATREPIAVGRSNSEGRYDLVFTPEEGSTYYLECTAFSKSGSSEPIQAHANEKYHRDIAVPLNLGITVKSYKDDGTVVECQEGKEGRRLLAVLYREKRIEEEIKDCRWSAFPEVEVVRRKEIFEADLVPRGGGGEITIGVAVISHGGVVVHIQSRFFIAQAELQMIGGKLNVQLERTATPSTLDQAFWHAIRKHADAISFERYRKFIDKVLCDGYDFPTMGNTTLEGEKHHLRSARHGVQAYELLKLGTQVFLLLHCGVRCESDRGPGCATSEMVFQRLDDYLGCPPQLPYIKRVIRDAFPWLQSDGWRQDCVLMGLHEPCLIELIKEYFLEEGMLMQTMNAILMRFQNVHAAGDRDPLANFEIDPLRPLNNFMWGMSRDLNLLSVRRRAYEYMHQYGLALYGKATASMHPADNRSKFLEAFHNLLYLCSVFFKEDNDTTVIADGYPLLSALKEVHLVLAQGAHNQFGDLPWTARAETLVMQWILAQPETRDFLQSRAMVPYAEAWMPQVDTMKILQGWSDVTVTNFRDLAEFGERIVLSIRFGNWIAYVAEDHAKNWARFFRADIQAYLHAYRAITGVDLTNPDTVDSTLPAVHLQRRLSLQHVAR